MQKQKACESVFEALLTLSKSAQYIVINLNRKGVSQNCSQAVLMLLLTLLQPLKLSVSA